ncbi:MAG: YesL family protein [Faecousia sp.]
MARSLFHPDNPLMITIGQITDCIFLSLFWLLGCFPVLTAGASTAALYDAVYHGFRKGDRHCWRRFFHALRQNLKPGLLPTVIFLAAGTGLVRLGVWFWNGAVLGRFSWAVFSGAAFVLLVILGIGSILFPLLSRFETTTAHLFSNTIRLGMANLPRTVALGLINGVCIFFCVRLVLPLFILPGLTALISTLFIEPMLKPYMPGEEEEDAAQ